jgi:hypothetical protein
MSRHGRPATVIRLADRSDHAVFLLTRGCGACAMQAQESRTRSRITRSTPIREFPDDPECLETLRPPPYEWNPPNGQNPGTYSRMLHCPDAG